MSTDIGAGGSTGGVGASTGAAIMASTGGALPGALPGAWGDDWRTRMAGGDAAEAKRLERFEGPDKIYQSYREFEKRLSTGDLRSTLKKDASQEEVTRWRQENGIPGRPEDYKINRPAGQPVPPVDDPFLKSFLKSAHEAHFTQGQVDNAINAFYSEVTQQQQAASEKDRATELATDAKLRAEWGADYSVNKQMAENLLSRAPAGFRDRFLNGYLADRTPVKGSPDAWKWLATMEREINPTAALLPNAGGNQGLSLAAEIVEMKKLMADSSSKYWKGPESATLQDRYRQLVTANETMKARAQA